MVASVILFALLAALLGAGFIWLLRRGRVGRDSERLLQALSVDELLPRHFRYFSQVRQALSPEDEKYLAQFATPEARGKALGVRHEMAMEFLRGLREDYGKFDRLARALTALAPTANPQREVERIWLGIQFGVKWRIVWLNLQVGATPVLRMQKLADQIGTLSTRLENSIRIWQEGLAASRPATLNA